MSKVKIGVVGAYRGAGMINYCKRADNAQIVAICDKEQGLLDMHKELAKGMDIAYYDNFDEFLNHDMDAVVLANYAHEHAPFAMKALRKGLHVYSEVLPAVNLKQAIELIETVEETGLVYAYGENFCYMAAPYEMRKLYKQGVLGEFEYGEGEYVHNCESQWPGLTYGEKDHWRNNMYSTFYCTHSMGPIIHITGLRPVSVVGFEGAYNERNFRVGAKSACLGMELVTLENGGIVKSIHGGLYKNSVWYSVYGSKGRMESAREDARAKDGHTKTIHVNCDAFEGEYNGDKLNTYMPTRELDHLTEGYGHGGSDFYIMHHFCEKVKGNPEADTIDIYEAMDMYLPGLFAYFSILDGNVPKKIPNFRNKEERDEWRNNTACTIPQYAGDMLLPTTSKGTPDIADKVYEKMAKIWYDSLKCDTNRRKSIVSTGIVDEEERKEKDK